MSNKGKVVLITGASSGIGKETAKTLIQEGYTVYAAARRVERMQDLKELGGIPIKMDVTKEEDVVAAVEQIKANHDGVDILITMQVSACMARWKTFPWTRRAISSKLTCLVWRV